MSANKNFYYILPLLLLLYCYGNVDSRCSRQIDHIVSLRNGKVLGTILKSRNGRDIHAYMGIPYAKPPIGELRFRAPQPADPWQDVLNATQDGPICKQKNYFFQTKPAIEGSEDCLYLNVYTPLNTDISKELLPVLVVIHWGGFVAGSSRSTLIGPQYLLDKDIVMVSFNYRLGIFGFLSSLDDEAPGNFGMKDQVLALKWVQENIAAFGGDPTKVTITGGSAGAGSVHLHIVSPLSKGLFRGAISQSGTALNLWARPFNELQKTTFRGIGQIVGCNPEGSSQEIIDCMRIADSDKLVSAIDAFKYFDIEPITVFGIVTEIKTASNPEPFLTEDPLKIIESGNFKKIPWIIGTNKDEGVLRTAPLIRQSQTRNQLIKNFDTLGPNILLLSLSVPINSTADIWKNLTNFYMNGKPIDIEDPTTIQGFTNMVSDRAFIYGTYQSALYHSYKGHRPIWVYSFNYRGKLSFGDVFAATKETVDFDMGVCHLDDYLYLYPSPDIFPKLPDSDLKMSKLMVKLWTDFIINGSPTPKSCSSKQCNLWWDPIPDVTGQYPMKNGYLHYLNISGPTSTERTPYKLDMRNDFLTERMRFWESLPVYENIPGIE